MIKENANELADPNNVIDFVYNTIPDKFSDNDRKGVKGDSRQVKIVQVL